MKKIAILLIITMIFSSSAFLTSCGIGTNTIVNGSKEENIESKEIVLTKDNFEDYFEVDLNPKYEITRNKGGVVAGAYVPDTYSGVINIDIEIFAKLPIEAYNVRLELKILPYVASCYDPKNIKLTLSYDGSANKSITIGSKSVSIFERDLRSRIADYIISVEGNIKLK